MKWLLSLLATAALGGAAEPPPTVEAEVLLLPGNSCLCGIRGAAVVRNPTRHDARIEVSLVAPPGWMVEPSTLQMTTLAESASMVELKIWTPRRIAVRDYTLELGVAATIDGRPLEPRTPAPYRMDEPRCMLGEPLCH